MDDFAANVNWQPGDGWTDGELILSWDGYINAHNDKWTGIIYEHNPARRTETVERWRKDNAKSEYNLSVAQEAAHQRLVKEGVSKFQPLTLMEAKQDG